MKTECFPFNCAVQSITDDAGRRTLKFTRIAPDIGPVQPPVKRHKLSFRLAMVVVPEAAFSFEPAIQVRSPARP